MRFSPLLETSLQTQLFPALSESVYRLSNHSGKPGNVKNLAALEKSQGISRKWQKTGNSQGIFRGPFNLFFMGPIFVNFICNFVEKKYFCEKVFYFL